MSLLVDTSVWSHAFRRDGSSDQPQVRALVHALKTGELVVTTGLILQELLQGFSGPQVREAILEHFNTLPFLVPDRTDHIEAADLRNRCRRKGIQVGTIDALLAGLCIRHGLTILTTDADFDRIARRVFLEQGRIAAEIDDRSVVESDHDVPGENPRFFRRRTRHDLLNSDALTLEGEIRHRPEAGSPAFLS